MTSPQDRPRTAADQIDPEIFTPEFNVARDAIRHGIALAAEARTPDATTLAVLMAETLPRLVNVYGPARAALILSRIAHDIGTGIAPNCRPQ